MSEMGAVRSVANPFKPVLLTAEVSGLSELSYIFRWAQGVQTLRY